MEIPSPEVQIAYLLDHFDWPYHLDFRAWQGQRETEGMGDD